MPRRREPTALLGVLLLGAVLPRCGGGPSESSTTISPRRGGGAVVGSISDVDAWNEYVSGQSFAVGLIRRIHLRLAQELGDSREHPPSFEPLLAESWSFSDDRLTLTFRLRDARWSDGAPITASDVRFTWKAQTAPEVAWVGADSKRFIRDVEVLDKRTVAFRFDHAYPEQLADAVEGGILPEHIHGRVPFAGWRTHDWSKERVGSGPLLLESHRPGEEIDLVRNPAYFREGAPLLDRVVVRVVPDAGSLLTQLLAGSVDYVEGISPEDASRARSAPGVKVLAFDVPQFDYIGWNARRPPLDDPMVRRALTLAVDRKALVEDLLYGYGRVSAGPLLSFWWSADPTLEPWPFDPAHARAILAERGFAARPGDGVLVRDGKPLEVEMTTNAGNRLREAVLVKVQEQLRRIGVAVAPRPVEMKTFRQKNMAGDFDAYVSGWRFSGKLDLGPIFGSDGLPPKGNNVVAYRSAEADRLFEDLGRASDWRAMKPIYAAIQRRIHEDQPYTFLYETERLAAVGPRLHGVEPDVPADPLARIERWWVER